MRSFKSIFTLIFLLSLSLGVLAQTSPFPQISALDATNHLNHEVTVADLVVQVAFRPTIWLLHLNQKAPASPLTCVVRGNSTNNFPNFENYLGQRVEVTGLIQDFRGRLELVLNSPNQIKVVGPAEAPPVAVEPPVVTTTAPASVVTAPPIAPIISEPKVVVAAAEPVTAPPVIVPQIAAAPQVAKPLAVAPTAPVQISEPKTVAPVTVATSPSKTLVKTVAPATRPTVLATTTPQAGDNASRTQAWIVALLGVISALLFIGVLVLWKRNPASPRTTSTGALVKSSDTAATDSAAVMQWKQRALVAEAMAGKQVEILREKIIPELTEFAKQSLIQGLVAQRTALLETNLAAQQTLIELETRLTTAQAPLQERIRAYEERIAELEKEVGTQGDQVRELTRASLMLLRKKLEDEREHARLQTRFN